MKTYMNELALVLRELNVTEFLLMTRMKAKEIPLKFFWSSLNFGSNQESVQLLTIFVAEEASK